MRRPPAGKSFIVRESGRADALKTDVGISNYEGLLAEASARPPVNFYPAIWDTGATGTCVTQKVAAECGLIPISKTQVTGVHGAKLSSVYLVHVFLPNNMLVPEVHAVEVPELAGVSEVLIGMDIIGLGDFAVNNYEGRTSFTFRIPSLEVIDFTARPNLPPRPPRP